LRGGDIHPLPSRERVNPDASIHILPRRTKKVNQKIPHIGILGEILDKPE
jgi:hypothetical protein